MELPFVTASSSLFFIYRPLFIRAPAGLSASSGIIQVLPAFWAPLIRPPSHSSGWASWRSFSTLGSLSCVRAAELKVPRKLGAPGLFPKKKCGQACRGCADKKRDDRIKKRDAEAVTNGSSN